uniref:DUF1758 domain-containing protein n=1 Tax=Trichuris muris TaxID=70415 RepID=A0A5S6QQ15_TRIMR
MLLICQSITLGCRCRDLIYALGGGEDAYKEALRSLKASCGRRDVIRAAHLQALDKLDPGRSPSQLKRFAERTRIHLFDLSRTGETSNMDIVDRLVAKLSIQDRLAWHEACQRDSHPVNLLNFGQWLCNRAAAYQNAHELAAEQAPKTIKEFTEKNIRNHARSHAMTAHTGLEKQSCAACSGNHSLSDCVDFKKLGIDHRWQLVKKRKLCFSCLQGKHPSRECRQSKLCGVNGCDSIHHPLLHRQPKPPGREDAIVNSTCVKPGRVALGAISVYAVGPNGDRTRANLFFDEGSDKTFIYERVSKRLRLKEMDPGQSSLMTRGFGGTRRWFNSRLVNVKIER